MTIDVSQFRVFDKAFHYLLQVDQFRYLPEDIDRKRLSQQAAGFQIPF
jgi:hypothetical protein